MSARSFAGGGAPAWLTSNQLTTGEETFSRDFLTSSLSHASGIMRLTYFTARKTEVSTQCRMWTGTTAAAATPTLCRMAIFEVAANGNGTLVASTPNDTTLFAAASTAYTRSWSSSFTKVAGRRYAFGALVVTGATAPTFAGQSILLSVEASTAPAMGWALTGLADVPASFTAGVGSSSGNRVYGVILP